MGRAADEENLLYCGCAFFGFAILGILIGVLPFVIFVSEDTEIVVLYSNIFAEFESEPITEGGVHTKPYAARVIKWPRVETNVEYTDIFCNSADGLLINADISFQYVPDPTRLIELTRVFGSFGKWEDLMVIEAESAIRDSCGDFIADDFQNRRGVVALGMENSVTNATEEFFGAFITKLQLKQVQRPVQFENAVRDKENARSEIRLAENEREQALTQALTKVDVANEEALRIIDTAETNAEIKNSQAVAQSEAIIDRFRQFATVFKGVKDNQGLTVPGILTYISNEVFKTDVTIAVDAPVELNFKDDL